MSSLSAMKKNKLCFFFLHYIHRIEDEAREISLDEITKEVDMKEHEKRAVLQYLTSEALISVQDTPKRNVSLTRWGKEALNQAAKHTYSSHYYVGGHEMGI